MRPGSDIEAGVEAPGPGAVSALLSGLVFLRGGEWESESLGSPSSPCFENWVKWKYEGRH